MIGSIENAAASLSLALRAAKMVAWEWDLKTDLVRWSGNAREFYGVSKDAPFEVADNSFALLHPDDAEASIRHMKEALRGEKDYWIEFRIIRPDNGRTVWAEARGDIIRNDKGDPVRVFGVTLDITERKLAEERAQQSTALLQVISNTTTAAMYVKDRYGRMLFANPALLALWGRDAEDLLGKTDLEFQMNPEDAGQIMESDRRIIETRRGASLEETVELPEGRRIFLSKKEPFHDAAGKVAGIVGVSTDVTDSLKHTAQLRALAQASLRITAADSTQEILDTVASEARLIIGAHLALAKLKKGEQLLASLSASALAAQKGKRFLDLESQDCEKAFGKAPLKTQLVRLTHADLIDRVFYASPPVSVRGLLASVIVSREAEQLGCIQLTDKYQGADFDDDDEFILVQLTQLAGAAFERITARDEELKLLSLAQSAQMQAESANQAKDDFLAILSHELRSPLNAMLGWLRILKQGGAADDPRNSRAVATLERNIAAQSQLINDLLDVSRIISGKLQLNSRLLLLSGLVSNCIESVRPTFESAGVTLTFESQAKALYVHADVERLQQVLTNLLNNAVKFTEPGGKVSVKLQADENRAEIIVEDTGKGIDAALLPRVFDRFRQGDSSTTRRHGGLGLGLSIVKHITELHGGEVKASSDGPGKGAKFTVTIPVANAHADAAPSYRSGASADTIANLQILVVEDDADSREALTLMLELSGASVRSVSSVPEALDAVANRIPDVLISDIGIPGQDGYALIRKLRESKNVSIKDLVAIAVSGFASNQDHQAALDAGFNEHLGKPVDFAKLLERIQFLVQNGAHRTVTKPVTVDSLSVADSCD